MGWKHLPHFVDLDSMMFICAREMFCLEMISSGNVSLAMISGSGFGIGW